MFYLKEQSTRSIPPPSYSIPNTISMVNDTRDDMNLFLCLYWRCVLLQYSVDGNSRTNSNDDKRSSWSKYRVIFIHLFEPSAEYICKVCTTMTERVCTYVLSLRRHDTSYRPYVRTYNAGVVLSQEDPRISQLTDLGSKWVKQKILFGRSGPPISISPNISIPSSKSNQEISKRVNSYHDDQSYIVCKSTFKLQTSISNEE